jgi:rare lipoprotein A
MHVRITPSLILAAGLLAGFGALPAQAETPGPAQASSWHTVVIIPPLPVPAVRPPIVVSALPPRATPLPTLRLWPAGPAVEGIASFYWQSRKTASGERFDRTALTAAHRTLPFDTRARVTHLKSGRSVVVRINDRGPFRPGRIIDLSPAAARAIGLDGDGLARVSVEVVH